MFDFAVLLVATPVPVVVNCAQSAPTNWGWFYSPGFAGLAAVGAAVVAYGAAMRQSRAVLTAASLSVESADRREAQQQARIDQGIRRQVEALVDRVGYWVFIARTVGVPDFKKMGESVQRLQERIYLWEVSTALTDAQAEALYTAAAIIGSAYRSATGKRWVVMDEEYTPSTQEWHEFEREVQDTFNASCGALRDFWQAMGDAERSKAFDDAYDPPPDASSR